MQIWKVRNHNGYTTSLPYETYEISGESLKKAVSQNVETIILHTRLSDERVIDVEDVRVKWSDSILGGKGGAVAEITVKISNCYTRESPKYKEKHKVYAAWIYADKDDLDHSLTSEKTAEPNAGVPLVALAAMEAYRLKGGSNDPTDYAIRVCQSILAEVLGFNSRIVWTGEIQSEGLLNYDGDYKDQYRALLERIRSEVK